VKTNKKNTTKQLCRDQTQLAKVNNVYQQGKATQRTFKSESV